ncbi:DUF1707 domain-containing protein [Epidermidibacterium keratini]|uniref:DUF1707 domain-containing protein n=1 Tax=Epidermidibacterium keratini TaxID=1891644 RepID=A0A7L4YS70_9ACTN|nr:DUF1707 domain-containing protein [Epidermidibacterium keratini]QHC01397.1 DUF1707 domain-containing protein [Epidermidibacterium keratini]
MNGGPTHEPADDQVRVGHAEREQVVQLLQASVAGGYLDLNEFEQRVSTVHESTTRGELRAVLADLPAADRSPVAPQTAPAAASTTTETINADWGTARRRGNWRVPSRLVLSGTMGTIELDLNAAELPIGDIEVDLQVSWSTVRIWLPPHMPLDLTAYEPSSWSKVKDKAGPPADPAGAALRLRGRPSVTTVVVRRGPR